jgi:hypothetical protein
LPDDERRTARAAIKRWLSDEFALITAGKAHHIRALQQPASMPVDAP